MRNFISEHTDSQRRILNETAVLRRRTPYELQSPSANSSPTTRVLYQQQQQDIQAAAAAASGSAGSTNDLQSIKLKDGSEIQSPTEAPLTQKQMRDQRRQQKDQMNDDDDGDVIDDGFVMVDQSATSALAFDLQNDEERKRLWESDPMKWFSVRASELVGERPLQVGIVVIVLIVLLLILATVMTNSGSKPDTTFPRLMFFFVDGVSVDEFKEAAALRRVPSMGYFATQAYNCRPDVPRSSPAATTNLLDQCTMRDQASHTGNIFSLLTGQPFSKDQSLESLRGYNFTSFLRVATHLGLRTAILGGSPLLSVPGPVKTIITGQGTAGGETSKRVQTVECGIVDFECKAVAAADPNTRVPECVVPARGAAAANSQLITRSSSCNSAFKYLIDEEDTPEDIWKRLEFVLESDADVILVQLPEKTVRRWAEQHNNAGNKNTNNNNNNNNNKKDAVDAALFSVDGLFSNLVRATAVKSAQDGEQWLTFLSVSNAPQSNEILMASNIFDSGRRMDVSKIIRNVWTLTPAMMYEIISVWLKTP